MTAMSSHPLLLAALAEIDAAMRSPVMFEPIWSTRHGRYQGFYAMIDDRTAKVRRMSPGATRQEAVESLLANLIEIYPERFEPTLAVAAE